MLQLQSMQLRWL